jgi:hypothetical protein
MKKMFKIIVPLFFIVFLKTAYAQESKSSLNEDIEITAITPMEKAFIQIFSKSDPSLILKDSVCIYAINFNIKVIREENNKTRVTEIIANDSLGYRLFPRYNELKKLNYSKIFLKGEKRISIVMPVLIYSYTEDKIKYKDEKGNPLVSLKEATNAAFHLYNTTLRYNNLKEAKKSYPSYPIKKNRYIYMNKSIFFRQIILEPMISNLTRVR